MKRRGDGWLGENPTTKLGALRVFVAEVEESNEAHALNDRMNAAILAVDAALRLSDHLGVFPEAFIDLLNLMKDSQGGKLPDWFKPKRGGSHLVYDERASRSFAVAVVERLKADGISYKEAY